MDSAHIATINKTPITFTRNVYFNAPNNTDTITEGMALCWDVTAATVNRNVYVTKPTLLNSSEFCGVVAPGVRQTGSGWVEVLIADGVLARGVNVYTDENITAGDLLGVIPGEYALGKVVVGRAVARAIESQDRTTTAGLVNTHFGCVEGCLSPADVSSKVNRFFDHFASEGAASQTADAGRYAATLNSGTVTFLDGMTIVESGIVTAAKSGYGVMTVQPTSTTETSIQLNGEPFSINAGQSLFFRARISTKLIASTTTGMIGIAVTDTSPVASAPSDFISFNIGASGALTFVYDSTAGSSVTSTPSVNLVAATFREVAFLVRKRASGKFDLKYWIDGTAYTPTITAASVPDAESLTFTAGIIDSSNGALTCLNIDRVEINHYFN